MKHQFYQIQYQIHITMPLQQLLNFSHLGPM